MQNKKKEEVIGAAMLLVPPGYTIEAVTTVFQS
jgi:hypothetical protein